MDKNQMIVDRNLESVFWLPCLTVLFVHHLCRHLNNCSFIKFFMNHTESRYLILSCSNLPLPRCSFKPNLFHHHYDYLFLPRRPRRVQTQGEGGLGMQEVKNTALVVDLGTKVINSNNY